jgi:hypothetical protein
MRPDRAPVGALGSAVARLVLELGLVGCGLVPGPVEVDCTLIGCDSQIVFELDDGELVPGFAYELEACFDHRCETATVELPEHGAAMGVNGALSASAEEDIVALVLPEGDYPGVHTARLRVQPLDGGGEAFEATVETELERTQPNGPDCPPVCWQAVVRL